MVAFSSVALAATPAATSSRMQTEGKTLSVNSKVALSHKGEKKLTTMEMIGKSALRKSPRKISPNTPPESEPVEEQPEGELTEMARSSEAYASFWGSVDMYYDEGLIVNRVVAPDGKIWFDNPMSQYPTHNWYYATEENGVLTIPGGQVIGYEWVEDEETWEEFESPIVLMACELRMDDEGDGWYFPAEDTDYRLIADGDSYVSEDPDLVLGLCFWNEIAEEYQWFGYGDYSMTYSPNRGHLVEVPADMTVEPWAIVFEDGSGYYVNVGVTPDAIYLQGLYNDLAESWVRLALDGDKAVMAPGQYLGKDNNWHYAYAMAGTLEEVWNDWYEEYEWRPVFTDELVFAYDAEKKTLISDGAFVVSPSDNPYAFTYYIGTPCLAYQDRKPGTPPAAPFSLQMSPYDEAYGNGFMYFNLPCVDTNGALLDVNNLYYRLYIDGEVYEFCNDLYWSLPESETTLIPWSLDDNWDFYTSGIAHSLVYYFTGFDTFGIQSVYFENGDESNELSSVVVTYDPIKVESVVAGEVAAEQWYDLQGRALVAAPQGPGIVKRTYSDGKVVVSKAMSR